MRACHEGPTAVLQEVKQVLQRHPQVAELEQKVSYLCKRERYMQSPRYQELGWPSGSGRVESANKGVVQARLKGAGMRWERSPVHPMWALRTAVCSDQWEEAGQEACQQRLLLGQERRQQRQERRQQAALSKLSRFLLRLLLLGAPTGSTTCHPGSHPATEPAAGSTASPAGRRPAADHPGRRRLLAQK